MTPAFSQRNSVRLLTERSLATAASVSRSLAPAEEAPTIILAGIIPQSTLKTGFGDKMRIAILG